MERQGRGDLPGQPRDAEVLDDDGVDPGGAQAITAASSAGSSASKTRVLRVT
jgi:hypothetical protein